jgi:hypothetical protein
MDGWGGFRFDKIQRIYAHWYYIYTYQKGRAIRIQGWRKEADNNRLLPFQFNRNFYINVALFFPEHIIPFSPYFILASWLNSESDLIKVSFWCFPYEQRNGGIKGTAPPTHVTDAPLDDLLLLLLRSTRFYLIIWQVGQDIETSPIGASYFDGVKNFNFGVFHAIKKK